MRFRVRATREFGWLVERTEACLTAGARGIECINGQGRIVGMVTYDRWTSNSCEVSVALDVPIAWRALRRPAFAYPFIEAGKGLLLCGVSHMNDRCRALVAHLGFREVCQIEDQIAIGIDLHLFAMRREDCRWLKER